MLDLLSGSGERIFRNLSDCIGFQQGEKTGAQQHGTTCCTVVGSNCGDLHNWLRSGYCAPSLVCAKIKILP